MPLYQLVPQGEGEGQTVDVRSVDTPDSLRTPEEIAAERLKFKDDQRVAERYGALVQYPQRSEEVMISDETRKRMDEQHQQKAEVPNVVTASGDIAKVASGSDVNLVPAHEVYRSEDPVAEGDSMQVEDPTVNPAFRAGGGSSARDRAEVTLAQPRGDAVSSQSATGPGLPVGQAADPEGEQKKVADEDQGKERERLAKETQKAGAAGEKAAQKDAPKSSSKKDK
jgi:hypothetical protein